MPNDIQTLAKIDRLLSDMDPEEADRILDWLTGKYSKTVKAMRSWPFVQHLLPTNTPEKIESKT